MLTSYGLCSFFGFVVSPLHNFIPFLLLGLGVDDMFIIARALDYYTTSHSKSAANKRNIHADVDDWNSSTNPENYLVQDNKAMEGTLEEERRCIEIKDRNVEGEEAGIDKKLAETMKHSGVSITITSLTDFIAFAIGATTSIPALKSFCMFCAVGIMSVFFYQATWFTAWMVIDERRKSARRNAFIPFITHALKDGSRKYNHAVSTEASFKQLNPGDIYPSDHPSDNQKEASCCLSFKPKLPMSNYILRAYSEVLSHIGTQITIILITIAILVVSIYGNI